MDSTLQQILRSLCFNSDWKYAVFWKLNHRSRMVLTLEDAYYDNHELTSPPEAKGFSEVPTNLHGGRYTHDPLGLAIAKMSYHVYSLGEGIIGQVAVSGKHQWVFPEYFNNSHSSFELFNGWESQISAGIKTILVVAAGPCGVVQLGSLHKVDEDTSLVTRIRHLFLGVKDPLANHATDLLQCSLTSSTCLPNLPSEHLHVEAFPDCSGDLDKPVDREGSNVPSQYTSKQSSTLPYSSPLSYLRTEKAVEVIDGHLAAQVSMSGSSKGAKCGFSVELVDAKHETQVGTDIVSNALYEGETSGCRDSRRGSDPNLYPYSRNHVLDNAGLSAFSTEVDKFVADQSSSYLNSVHSALKMETRFSYQNEVLQVSGCQGNKHLQSPSESSQFDAFNTSMSSFAGSELLEALGPAFSKRRTNCEEQVNSETGAPIRLTEDVSISQLTFDSGDENLLDAVVANVCHSDGNVRHEISSSRSAQSLLTTVEMAESSSHEKHIIVNSVGSEINQPPLAEGKTLENPSDICGAFSSIAFSSTCPSSSSEHFQTSLEMPKKNKKRAKPGENSRPRPRDRQLIQDRIKELRELVPNGSKCSIDSLLERTIKHMLFLQNVTKHADKLSKCAGSKMQHKEPGVLGSTSAEQGSSWAVEVGGHLQVCSIVVENLNKQGLMLIEMLCEECSHFLEIANVIRSLDLTILRGITARHGEKTWICFVVEGQNNKVMHRMDILWSLVQIFQPKATAKQ